jgi:hypothetical protein
MTVQGLANHRPGMRGEACAALFRPMGTGKYPCQGSGNGLIRTTAEEGRV